MPTMQGTRVRAVGREDPLEKEMAARSSILENSVDRGAWWAIVHGAVESRTL